MLECLVFGARLPAQPYNEILMDLVAAAPAAAQPAEVVKPTSGKCRFENLSGGESVEIRDHCGGAGSWS